MIRATGGVPVIDVATNEQTYGHFERVPAPVQGDYGLPGMVDLEASVVIANGAYSEIGVGLAGASSPVVGLGRAVSVDGNDYTIYDIARVDDAPDGGQVRLMLAGA